MVRENIVKYLKNNGIKQSFVADNIGLSRMAMSNLVNGDRDLDVEEYVKICDLLKVNYDFFIDSSAITA